jgi:hypothetical protein
MFTFSVHTPAPTHDALPEGGTARRRRLVDAITWSVHLLGAFDVRKQEGDGPAREPCHPLTLLSVRKRGTSYAVLVYAQCHQGCEQRSSSLLVNGSRIGALASVLGAAPSHLDRSESSTEESRAFPALLSLPRPP